MFYNNAKIVHNRMYKLHFQLKYFFFSMWLRCHYTNNFLMCQTKFGGNMTKKYDILNNVIPVALSSHLAHGKTHLLECVRAPGKFVSKQKQIHEVKAIVSLCSSSMKAGEIKIYMFVPPLLSS